MEKGVVFKYPLNIGGVTVVNVPVRSQFLSVKAQYNEPVVYFLENAERVETEGFTEYRFYTVGTGHKLNIKRGMEFIDTLLLHEGAFVIHVFKD